ncbi:MAG TPA: thymidylate synthase [Candidatus Lokiarchaeia archaeon]|nr:thymidylate synthase [Candidatus Lokiarchaeia archaeon]
MFIEEEDVASTWLEALRRVLAEGDDVPTQYDKQGVLPSKDATVMINIKHPFYNPIRNLRSKEHKIMQIQSKFGNKWEVYGVLADLFLVGSIQSGYIEEVLEGAHDKSLWESDRSFPYSYHDRIFNYAAFSIEDATWTDHNVAIINKEQVKSQAKLKYAQKVVEEGDHEVWKLSNGVELSLDREISEQLGVENLLLSVLDLPRINQVDQAIQQLRANPHTRRAQAITWRPYVDPYVEDPPCLQRLYFRVKDSKLLLETCWRSRDLFKAWEANVNAMIRIQKRAADELELETAEYVEFVNSLHIYGKDIAEARKLLDQVSGQQ